MAVYPIGKHTVAEVREDPRLVDAVRKITGLGDTPVRKRLTDAAGNMHVSRLFGDVWPTTAADLAERTAAFAREYGFQRELRRITRATQVLVSRRLNDAAGKTMLRNLFREFWPEDEEAEPPDLEEYEVDEADGAADPFNPSDHVGETHPLNAPDVRIAGPSRDIRLIFPDPDGRGVRIVGGPSRRDGSPPAILDHIGGGGPGFRADTFDGVELFSADEVEPEESSVAGAEGFDPNEIRVKLWTPTVDLVLTRLREDEIDLAPDFQREAGIWTDRNQSRLIESLLIRVPLPAFYMDSSDEDRLLVIDGIQRLTALKRFVTDNELVLQELEYLYDCNGKRFADLPRPFRRRIEETMLTVHVIDKGTPDGAKLNIFKRLNTGGMPLTPQEVRHAMSPGPVREFLKALSVSPAFERTTQRKFSDKRMTARECALRFCAFILTPPSDYPPVGDLDKFLLDAMKKLNEMSDPDRRALARRFERAMTSAGQVLGDQAFRKPRRPGRPRPPVNKALFEAWAVGFDARTDEELAHLKERGVEVQQRFEKLVDEVREFEQALSQGTGDPTKVKLRFDWIDALLDEVANLS